MANRNKKKGFLKEMMGVRGSKTVFNEEGGGRVQILEVAGNAGGDKVGEEEGHSRLEKGAGRRALPPSVRQGLPSNVFVTSREFTRPLNAERRSDLDRRDRGAAAEEVWEGNSDGEQGLLPNGHGVDKVVRMWERAERGFDALETLTSVNTSTASLIEGALVAWKVCRLSKDFCPWTIGLRGNCRSSS